MLPVRRGQEALAFYKSAFGAKVLYRVEAPDGAVVARLSVDGAEFWVADESPEHKNLHRPHSLLRLTRPEWQRTSGNHVSTRCTVDALHVREWQGYRGVAVFTSP